MNIHEYFKDKDDNFLIKRLLEVRNIMVENNNDDVINILNPFKNAYLKELFTRLDIKKE